MGCACGDLSSSGAFGAPCAGVAAGNPDGGVPGAGVSAAIAIVPNTSAMTATKKRRAQVPGQCRGFVLAPDGRRVLALAP